MDFRLLYYFVILADELNYRLAAEKLSITQPTLSHQIKVFENRIGVTLFERQGRGIILTEAGRILQSKANKIFSDIETTIDLLEPYKNLKDVPHLVIACSGSHTLSGVLKVCSTAIPDLRVTVLEMTTAETIQALKKKQVDISLINLPIREKNVEVIPIFEESFHIVISENHPLANNTDVSLKMIEKEKLVLLERDYYIRNYLDEVFISNNVAIQPYYELQTYDACLNVIKEGIGVTILPKSFLFNQEYQGIKTYPLKAKTHKTINLGIVYRQHEHLNTFIQKFIQLIKEYYGV